MGNFNSRPVPTNDNSEHYPTRAFQPGRSIRRRATILNFRVNNTTNNVETNEPPQPNAYEKLVKFIIMLEVYSRKQ